MSQMTGQQLIAAERQRQIEAEAMSNQEEISRYWIIGSVLFGVVYFICLLGLSGVVFTKLWNWHAVSLGHPSITVSNGVGLTCLAGTLLGGYRPRGYAKGASLLSSVVVFVGPPVSLLLLLGVGWVAS